MLNETHPNEPHERPARAPRAVGPVEVAFVTGFALAVAGVALVSIPAALFAAGFLLMVIAWRTA